MFLIYNIQLQLLNYRNDLNCTKLEEKIFMFRFVFFVIFHVIAECKFLLYLNQVGNLLLKILSLRSSSCLTSGI